jgi:hypothetical protein
LDCFFGYFWDDFGRERGDFDWIFWYF